MHLNKTIRWFLALLLIYASSSAYGRKPFKFERISIEHGLSQVTVYSILKDHDGFMWFGTQEGLNRYDGYRFTIFWHDPDNPNSLGFNSVLALMGDRNGNIWIGTFLGGLNRYNTRTGKFFRYQNDPVRASSLSHDLVRSIVEDKAGRIWFATDGGGLNLLVPAGDPGKIKLPKKGETDTIDIYDPKNARFIVVRQEPGQQDGIGSNFIKVLHLGRDGEIWAGTHGGGLTKITWTEPRFNNQWFPIEPGRKILPLRFERFTHDPGNPGSISDDYILAICQDKKGILWVGTAKGGLNRFNRESGTFTRFTHNPAEPGSLRNHRVTALTEDRGGYLWIGTGDGLDILPPNRDPNSKTQVFTHNRKEVNNSYSLSDNMILSLYEDPQGIVWIGTEGGGFNTYNRKKYKFDHYTTDPSNPRSLSDPVIRCIIEDRAGRLWLSTNKGVNRMNRETGEFDHFFHSPGDPFSLSDNIVRVIFEDSRGNLWFGSENGSLDKIIGSPDAKKLRFENYKVQEAGKSRIGNEAVISIGEDSEGMLWAGTHGKGVSRINPVTRRYVQYKSNHDQPGSLSYDIVRFTHEDSRGRLWLGTDGGGLNLFSRQRETFTVFMNRPGDPESLSSNYLLCAYESPAAPGILWLGTHGGGLVKMDLDTGKCVTYKKKHGLPNDVVYGILEATVPGENEEREFNGDPGSHNRQKIGKLWLSTNKGLCEFDPETLKTRTYNRGDGLQSDEFNGNAYFKSKSGRMFFGGLHGFNAFHPYLLASNPHVPPVVLTEFSLFNRPVPLTGGNRVQSGIIRTLPVPLHHLEEIHLSYTENFFSFQFAALDYTAPIKSSYSYRLEGIDKEWISCGAEFRQANYTGIPPGTYTFRVKGSNNDGIWNENGASLRIIIEPPFWQSITFRIIILVVVISIITAFIRLRINGVTRRAREEQARMKREMEKKELEKELKMKADWTSMLVHELRSPLTAILGYSELMAAGTDNPEITSSSQLISKSTDRMLSIINDMLDISKFEAGKMKIRRGKGNLAKLLTEVVRFMTPLSGRKKLKVIVQSCELPDISLDPETVRQVIENLFSNAIKFSPPGSSIVISCRRLNVDERVYHEFSIKDEGPGVQVESRPYLFDKYAQVHQDVKIKGTGLGLAVSQLIIDAHGGEIGYRSPGDKGSIFYFRLPVDA